MCACVMIFRGEYKILAIDESTSMNKVNAKAQ